MSASGKIKLRGVEDLEPLDELTTTLGLGLSLVDRTMTMIWANAAIRRWRADAGCSSARHCFDLWKRDSPCQDCLPRVVFRTGEPAEGVRERGRTSQLMETYLVKAVPVYDHDGELRWVLECLSGLSSLEPAVYRGWGDARLTQMTSSTGGAFLVVDNSDRIVSWSPAAEVIFGYGVDEVLGRNVGLLFPADRQDEKELIADKIRTEGQVLHLETTRRARDGRLFPAAVSARALRDEEGNLVGRSAVIEDLSTVRQLRDRLEAQEQLLGHIARESGDAVIGLDAGGAVASWSTETEALLGVDAAAMIGRPLDRLAGDGVAVGLLEHPGGGVVRGLRMTWRDHGGRDVPVEVSGMVWPGHDGAPAGMSLLVRDISGLLAQERRMMRSEKLAAVGSLAAGLAHEIGTPLNIISATAEYLLVDSPDDGEAAVELRGIVAETDRISKLVHELLTFARGSGSGWEAVDPAEAIQRALRLTRIPMERKDIRSEARIQEGIPKVRSEPDGLHQIFLNLLLNAVAAVPMGGQVTVSARALDGDVVTVEVADDGPGIPRQQRERVFDPFYTTRPDGTGLGLAVCARIVAALGGDIQVTDTPLGGACFVVHLPVARTSGEEP